MRLQKISQRIAALDEGCKRCLNNLARPGDGKEIIAFVCKPLLDVDGSNNYRTALIYRTPNGYRLQSYWHGESGIPYYEEVDTGFRDLGEVAELIQNPPFDGLREELAEKLIEKGHVPEIDWRPTETIPEDWY